MKSAKSPHKTILRVTLCTFVVLFFLLSCAATAAISRELTRC
ncbi:hypothetical protein FACS1894141_5800 [Spirochaetia bacterium]|nr:hypothetical protein FACS1894141_5800 [Spirochaetia bacterium]